MRWGLCFAIWALAGVAHASGPVERLVQVLLDPRDPARIVVRWGTASEGLLYGSAQGFAALCSGAIAPLAGGGDTISKLSSAPVHSNAGALLDGDGRVQVTQLTGLWSDDGTGCGWTHGLLGGWPTSLQLDPVTGELLATVNVSSGLETRALFLRRDASGSWSSFADGRELVPHVPGQQAFGDQLKVSGNRYYATVLTGSGEQTLSIVRSDDGGATWSAALPAVPSEKFSLVAADPIQPARLLGANTDDLAADVLLLSEDEGRTFQRYGELRQLTGVAFAPDGTVYLSDQGDATDPGGLWTAPQLGQPLQRLAGTAGLDCVTWSPGALYLCQGDRVRRFDPVSRAFVGADVVRLGAVDALLSCAGGDVGALCRDQLNMGASWCCTGHYPCAPFCSMYDVTINPSGQRVFCGQSGLAYDRMAGLSCEVPDAGAPDAGKITDEKARKSDDGCALTSRSGWGGALALVMLLRRRTRKR